MLFIWIAPPAVASSAYLALNAVRAYDGGPYVWDFFAKFLFFTALSLFFVLSE